jgi:hypothetical protein
MGSGRSAGRLASHCFDSRLRKRRMADPKPRYAFLKQNVASNSTSVEWTGSSL